MTATKSTLGGVKLGGAKIKNGITGIKVDPNSTEHTAVGEEMLGWLHKFEEIEEKSKCLRVQFLDWLSDKLLDWSNKLHVWSVNIDSPCVIKVEPRKKEESKDAKERKEIARLKELLGKEQERSEMWKKQANEAADVLTKVSVDDLAKSVSKKTKEPA